MVGGTFHSVVVFGLILEVHSQHTAKYFYIRHNCIQNYRLRHSLHQRTLYFSEHFTSQELNTLCSPTHFAKSQFTPQHPLHCYLLLKRTVCFKLACYSLLLNTLYPSAHFAYWNIFLLGTLCSPTLFASYNPLLLSTPCFSAHFTPCP